MRLDTKQTGMPMDWDLSQFGLGESIDTETAIIVLVASLGIACIGPLLAMGGRSGEEKDEGGHPLRSKLHAAEPIRPTPRQSPQGRMKYKTRVKYK